MISGFCAIKDEFVLKKNTSNTPHDTSESENASETPENQSENAQNDDNDEPPAKIPKLDEEVDKNGDGTKKGKSKNTGVNKKRPKSARPAPECKPCNTIVNIQPGNKPDECKYKNCNYAHDPIAYLQSKPKDISVNDEGCHIFNIRGHCPWGISCLFGSSHITSEGHNLIDDEKLKNWTDNTGNVIKMDTIQKLRRRAYDFNKVESFVRTNSKKNKPESESTEQSNGSGTVTDEDVIRVRDCEKTKIEWKDKLYLGPLTTLGNLPFRRICKEFGADITCGEMTLCDSLLKGFKQEWALVKRHASEDLFGVQICGTNPYAVAKVADILKNEPEIKADFVDLNLGCPINLIFDKGGGSGMLLRTNILENTVKCASRILPVPFTVKTRTGIRLDVNIAHKLIPKFFDWGASLVTLHGRSREQRYTKLANWDYIEECAKLGAPNPVFGNGDILSYDDYINAREKAPNVSGIMICRGGLIKPWIFTEIKERKLWDIRSSERFDILKKYVNYGLEHWGSDAKGVENTRRFLLEWCSFLYRYIPVGLLESPPQRINQRPPCYFGRDDLETMMASPNCADWIKLSEMLLGPVPDNFEFLPKHKANSF